MVLNKIEKSAAELMTAAGRVVRHGLFMDSL